MKRLQPSAGSHPSGSAFGVMTPHVLNAWMSHRGHELPNPGEGGQPGSKWQCWIAGAGEKTEGVTACVAFPFLRLISTTPCLFS